MAETQRPKLTPLAATAFFQHFVSHDSEVVELSDRKRTIRLLNVSKKFCPAAHEFLRNSKLDVRLKTIRSKRQNSYIFHMDRVAILNEQSAIAVFKLTEPEPKILSIGNEPNGEPRKIDPIILRYLSNVSELMISSKRENAKYLLSFANKLNSERKLKVLSCPPKYLDQKHRLKNMTVEKYYCKFEDFDAPFNFASVLRHEFRQVHLVMRDDYISSWGDSDSDDFDSDDSDWSVSMVTSSKPEIVQPAIEEIYLESMALDRLEFYLPFIPIKCFKRVPNLKKFFYYGEQGVVTDYDVEIEPKIRTYRLQEAFNYAKKVCKVGCQAQLIFVFTSVVYLDYDQSEEEWLRDLIRDSVFDGIKCEVTTRLKLNEDPDFEATQIYDRFGSPSSMAALICTAPQMKLFLWPYFHIPLPFSDDSAEMYSEDEHKVDEDGSDDDNLQHQETIEDNNG